MLQQLTKLAAVVVFFLSSTHAVDNGLAVTPQMGWDNWNAFGCDVSEELLLETAELIVSYGLRDLGYHYVILDDCWSVGRNASNNHTLVADIKKFPRGMAAVADDLHALDLGFGMYSDAGKYTCGGYAGSLGYEEVDANTWASWGVDYLKYDNCFNEGQAGNQLISRTRYATMSAALNATGRPILYSLCNWGEDYPWNWGSTIANSWRITGDIYDSWDRPDARCPCDGPDAYNCELPGFHCSVANILNKASFVPSKAQPGAWNDLDMLEVGNGAMSDVEYVAHFSLWAAVKSPLIMGNDIRKMTPSTLSILSNPAIIAISQDPSGSSAARRWLYNIPSSPSSSSSSWDSDTHSTIPSIQLWSGSLTSTTDSKVPDTVVLLINGGSSKLSLNASLADIFIDSGVGGTAPQVKMAWEVRDLWANRMSDLEGSWIIGNVTQADNKTMGSFDNMVSGKERWNATKTTYAQGLKDRDERLLGSVSSTVKPSGTMSAVVEAHGVRVFRLRAVGSGGAEL